LNFDLKKQKEDTKDYMATITEDYVSFEIAKLLKEKGFDEHCFCINYPLPEEEHHNIILPNLLNNSV